MKERPIDSTACNTEAEKLFLQRLPPSLVAHVVCHLMARNLTSKEQTQFKKLIKRAICGKPIIASQEVPKVFESQRSKIFCEGEENIPENGSTIVIGNHARGGPLYDMGQYFETARIVHDGRINVEDEFIREPYVIMQRGLVPNLRILGGKLKIPIPLAGQLTGQFYEIIARSTSWELVLPPKFDQNGQITNRQNLSRRAIERLEAGGAMVWYPQGKHTTDLVFPEKAGELLSRLKDKTFN